MGSNCCKGDASRPIRSTSSIYSRSRAGASLDDRFTTSDDAGGVRLTVSAAQTGDSGVYTLQASNAAGSATSNIRLEVSAEEAPTGEDPPTFLRRLQDLTVKVGSRTRFLVEIISSTECKVTWYRNERRLLEAERVALARDGNFWCADVAAVSVDDAGRWTCTAENAGGRASCSAHLNVLVPKAYKRPEFVEELRALLTEQGTVSLECKVVGVPTPVLRWFKDSREIKAGDVFALTANAEDPTSLGTYTCEAVNCMGRAYSSSKVHVVGRASREGSARPSSSGMTPEPPPIFTKELEDAHVKVCEHFTLGCHIVVPPWPRSVVWYNKEGKVEPGERYHVIEDGVGGYLLEIPSTEWADEGEWKCVATSAGGRVGISTCYVAMDVPKNYRKPRFMENLQAVLTEEGLVSFECKVVGFPTPVLSWFKDGQELKPGDVYQLTGTNSLGSYCCIARNCMGQASSSAELTVEDIQNQLNEEEKLQLFSKNQAPKYLQGLKSVEAKIDEPFRFTVKVAIPPEPSVLWYRDDQPVDESTRCHLEKEEKGIFNLDIQNLEFLDQAEWKCVAVNDFGHSVTSCFLKLIIPRHYKKPRFLENLQAILSEEGAVNLECKVIGVPQPVLKWYKDGEELKPGDIHRIISGQDGTCCLGTYTCEAQNCMGIAASSASLLGFDDSMKTKKKITEEQPLQRNLSLSTIHEERTSQMYDTPVGDVTLDDKGEISFSFDGKEVSVSLYETPDLTEEEALQIVEMYADQLSENVTEHNVVELPPLRFVKETSTSGNLLMEAIIIDVSPDYFAAPEEDLRTEADVEDLSIADENGIPQLSLDQEIEIGGENYLEKTMVLLSEEKSDFAAKSSRRKSDSQRSADDFFSLSRDLSLSEDKHDDDTHVSESELQSFASARSSAKVKSKSSKPSGEEGQESSEPTKTVLIKEEIVSKSSNNEQAIKSEQDLEVPVIKQKRERRTSRGSRRSSTSSEKSISKSREELLRLKMDLEQAPSKPLMSDKEYKNTMDDISTSLTKVINDVQLIERDIILKSELMSSAATASRSLEIISSLINPLSEIHSIADAAKESISESREVTSSIFNSIPQPLKALQQSLTIIEKCIDMESDNKTLVKKTCVAFVETCGMEIQKIIADITTIMTKNYINTEDQFVIEINTVLTEMITAIKFSAETIKARNLLTEASEIKPEKPTQEVKHLRDTQKAVFELKIPLNSLLRIVESAESGNILNLSKVQQSEVIMNDMSASIQDLQTALEQIETLSVNESSSLCLNKYNTEVIETVMDSVLKLRGSFEQLSTDPNTNENENVLKETLFLLKENLTEISHKIEAIDKSVGQFEILQSENKLDVLQKMAQILIALENNLPRLEAMPIVKSHMGTFHKNLTKVLEKVIESNDAKKYQTMMEVCNTVSIINSSIKNLDSENVLPLASLSNILKIIQTNFTRNIYESELNSSIVNNISDVLVGIQEAINKAEEMSQQIDSEYIQEISAPIIDKAKVDVILEHIDLTIAAVNTIKVIEVTQEFKLALTPTLENICPILEELRRCVASVRPSGVELDEQISDISETSFAETIATPLCELNQNIIVLNQLIVENIDFIKENTEVISAIAEPLHELHTTLEIIQQDVISQYGDDLTPYEVSVNMASVVQNLQSCIVMIQEQTGIEGAEEMSTLEDISAIKTSADTLPSDRFVLPTAEETAIEQSLLPVNYDMAATATAQTLQTLNEHIMVLQTPEVIEALDTLSEISDYANLKSVMVGLGDLHTGIEGILHPVPIEGPLDSEDTPSISKLATIAEPMLEIQQCLSVLDSNNIPIFENILDLPAEKIQSVFQSISDFKSSLEQCMNAVLPAMECTNNTIEISNKVSTLREVCEQLKEIFDTSKDMPSDILLPAEVKNFEMVVNNLIDATDVSKDIKIDQVKCITEELYLKVMGVQDEIIQFTTQSPEKISQEAKLIQITSDVEKSIAVLEQYDFIDLSQASDITTCMSPQIASEIDTESLSQLHDIADNAVNVLQDSYQDIPIADLMMVEDFFKTCKNEFTILQCLISKATTHKKIIRLLQEFNSLQTLINSFTTKRLELRLSDDVNECLTHFMIHADECLRNARISLVKVIDSQLDMLIKTPITKLKSIRELEYVTETKTESAIASVVKTLNEAVEIAKYFEINLQSAIVKELSQPNQISRPKQEETALVSTMEDLVIIIDTQSVCENLDDSTHKVFEKLTTCINKHHDYKEASGTGKMLIILKCLAECVFILQEVVTEKKMPIVECIKMKEETHSLKEVLAEMLQPLQALQTQLVNIQEQVLSGTEEYLPSIDISTTESIIQTMTELHKDIVLQIESDKQSLSDEDNISMIQEIDKEIYSIRDSIKSIENVQAGLVDEIAKPMREIEKSLHSVLVAEKETLSEGTVSKEVSAKLLHHIDQYIELIEIVEEISAIIKVEDVKETFEIARELRENIVTFENKQSEEMLSRTRAEQLKLVQKLQTALSVLQTQVLESTDATPTLNASAMQRIAQVTAQLQTNLDTATGVLINVQELESRTKTPTPVETTLYDFKTTTSTASVISDIGEITGFEQICSMNKDTLEEHVEMLKSVTEVSQSAVAEMEDVKVVNTSTAPLHELTDIKSLGMFDIEEIQNMEDSKKEMFSNKTVLREISTELDITPESSSDSLLDSITLKTLSTVQANLVQHITEYTEEVVKFINEVPNIINTGDYERSLHTAHELLECVTAQTNKKEETVGEVTNQLKQEIELAQRLEVAFTILSQDTFENLDELAPSVNKNVTVKVNTVLENLKTDLASLKVSYQEVLQCTNLVQQELKTELETTQLVQKDMSEILEQSKFLTDDIVKTVVETTQTNVEDSIELIPNELTSDAAVLSALVTTESFESSIETTAMIQKIMVKQDEQATSENSTSQAKNEIAKDPTSTRNDKNDVQISTQALEIKSVDINQLALSTEEISVDILISQDQNSLKTDTVADVTTVVDEVTSFEVFKQELVADHTNLDVSVINDDKVDELVVTSGLATKENITDPSQVLSDVTTTVPAQPISVNPLIEPTTSDQVVPQVAQNTESSDDILTKAAEETLTQNINAILSDDILQIALKQPINVEEFKTAMQIAKDLQSYLVSLQISTADELKNKLLGDVEQAHVIQQLQHTLSSLQNVTEKSPCFSYKQQQSVANVILQLAELSTALSSETIAQIPGLHLKKCELQDNQQSRVTMENNEDDVIVESRKTDNGDKLVSSKKDSRPIEVHKDQSLLEAVDEFVDCFSELSDTSKQALVSSYLKESIEVNHLENIFTENIKPFEEFFDSATVADKLPSDELIATNVREITVLENTKNVEQYNKKTESANVGFSDSFMTAVTSDIDVSEITEVKNEEDSAIGIKGVLDIEINLPGNINLTDIKKDTTNLDITAQKIVDFSHDVEPLCKKDLFTIDDKLDSTNQEACYESEAIKSTLTEKRPTVEIITDIVNEFVAIENIQNISKIKEYTRSPTESVSDSLSSATIYEVNTNEAAEIRKDSNSSKLKVAVSFDIKHPLLNVAINSNDSNDEIIKSEENITPELLAVSHNAKLVFAQDAVMTDKDLLTTMQSEIVQPLPDDIERSNLMQHIDAFITDEINEIINDISNITNIETLKESVALAQKLRESVMATDHSATAEETSPLNYYILEQVRLTETLQNALCICHTQLLDITAVIAPEVSPVALAKVFEIVTHLQESLKSAIEFDMNLKNQIVERGEIKQVTEQNSMVQLENLLQTVNMEINKTPADKNDIDDSELLKNTLDEVQTVIIKLKREYDGAASDTLNETLDDLECSVRSVQLQISEESPPELLTEACATLQLLVDNMNATQHIQITTPLLKSQKTENILEKCSIDSKKTVNLLDVASKLDTKGNSSLENIVSNLKNIKNSLKLLRESFLVDADTVIENGVEVVQCLIELEGNIFSLEKEVDSAVGITADTRDCIITAVHSVYGSISNMRSTVSSVQKRFMFEKYGQPSESLLHSIKNIATISSFDDEENSFSWKKLSKSLRKVLNHFEDIKFYIGLDKTARLPSDAAFTKIILEDLKDNIIKILVPRAILLDSNTVLEKVTELQKCIEVNFKSIESDSSLQVKNKIPMFTSIATEMLSTTHFMKNFLEKRASDDTMMKKQPFSLNLIKKDTSSNQELQQSTVTIEEQHAESNIAVLSETQKNSCVTSEDKKTLTECLEMELIEKNLPTTSYFIKNEVCDTTPKKITEEVLIALEKPTVVTEATTENFFSHSFKKATTDIKDATSLDVDQTQEKITLNSQENDELKQVNTSEISEISARVKTGDTSDVTLEIPCDFELNQTKAEPTYAEGLSEAGEFSNTVMQSSQVHEIQTAVMKNEDDIMKSLSGTNTVTDQNLVEFLYKENISTNEEGIKVMCDEPIEEEQSKKQALSDKDKLAQNEEIDICKIEPTPESKLENVTSEGSKKSTDAYQNKQEEKTSYKFKENNETVESNKDESDNNKQEADSIHNAKEVRTTHELDDTESKQKVMESENALKDEIDAIKTEEAKIIQKPAEVQKENEVVDVKLQVEHEQNEEEIGILKENVDTYSNKNENHAIKDKVDNERVDETKQLAEVKQLEQESQAKLEKDDSEQPQKQHEKEFALKQETDALQSKQDTDLKQKDEEKRALKDKADADFKQKIELKQTEDEACAKQIVDNAKQKQKQEEKEGTLKEQSLQVEQDADLKQADEECGTLNEKANDDLKQTIDLNKNKDEVCAKQTRNDTEVKQKQEEHNLIFMEEEANANKNENDAEQNQKQKEKNRMLKEETDALQSKQDTEITQNEEETRPLKENEDAESKQQEEQDGRLKKEADALQENRDTELKQKEEARVLKENEETEALATHIKDEKIKKEKEAADKVKREAELKRKEEALKKREKDDAEQKQKQEDQDRMLKEEADALQAEQDAKLEQREEKTRALKEKEDADLKEKDEQEKRTLEVKAKKEKEMADKVKQEAELEQKENEARKKREQDDAEQKQKQEDQDRMLKEEADALQAKKDAKLKQREEDARALKEKEDADLKEIEEQDKRTLEVQAQKEKEMADKVKQEAELEQKENEARKKREKDDAEQKQKQEDQDRMLKEEANALQAKKDAKLKQREEDARALKEKEDADLKEKEEQDKRTLEVQAKKEKEMADKGKQEAELEQKENEARKKREKDDAEQKQKQEDQDRMLKEEADALQAKKDAKLKQREEDARALKEKEDADLKEKEEQDQRTLEVQAQKEKEMADKVKQEAEHKQKEEARKKREKDDAEQKQKQEDQDRILKEEADALQAKQDAKLKQREEDAQNLREKEDADLKKKEEQEKRTLEVQAQKEKEMADKVKQAAELKQREEEALAKRVKDDAEQKQKQEDQDRMLKEKADALQMKQDLKLKKREEKARALREKVDTDLKEKEEQEKQTLEVQAQKDKEMADKVKQEAELKQKEDEARKNQEKDDAEQKQKQEDQDRILKEEADALQAKQDAKLKQREEEALAKREKDDAEQKQKQEDQDRMLKEEADALQAKKDAKLKQREKDARALKEKEDANLREKEEQKKRSHEAQAKVEKEMADKVKQEAELEQKENEARKKREKDDAEQKQKQEDQDRMLKDEADALQAKQDLKLKKKEEKARALREKVDADLKEKEEQEKRTLEVQAKKEKEMADKVKQEAELKQKEDEARKKQEKDDAEQKQKQKDHGHMLKEETDVLQVKQDAELKQKEEDARALKEKEDADLKEKEEQEKRTLEVQAKKEKEMADKVKQEAELKQKENEARKKREKDDAEQKQKQEDQDRMLQEEANALQVKQDLKLKKKEEKARALREKVDADLKKKEQEKRTLEVQAKNEKDMADKVKQEAELKQKEDEARKKQEKDDAKQKQRQEDQDHMLKEEADALQAKPDAKLKQREEKARALREKEDADLKEKVEQETRTLEVQAQREKEMADKVKQEAELKQNEEARALKEKADTNFKENEKQEKRAIKVKAKEAKKDKKVADRVKQETEFNQREEKTLVLKAKVDLTEDEAKDGQTGRDAKDNRKTGITRNENKESFSSDEPAVKNNANEILKKTIKYTERLDKSERRDDELHIYKEDSHKKEKTENGDMDHNKIRSEDHEQHYIREYQYRPTQTGHKLEVKEKPKFVDHNHRDYTMEFARPSGYREKSFDVDKPDSLPLHDYLGRNAAIFKAQTLVLDSQLRSPSHLLTDPYASRTSEPPERRSEIRHRSKAHSEARTGASDKRTGLSRDSKRKPVFSTYLTDRTAVEGSRVKLTCSVLSSSDPTVTWYKNGVLLDNKLKYRTKFMDGLITMEVLNAVPSDSAEYSCTIQNENGAVNSSASLKVYPSFEASPIPPTFTRSIRDTYHLAENELVLECRIRGQPLPTITWLKDDKSISTNSRYQAYYLADGVCRLAIEHPTPEDSGKYTCKAENSVWSDQITHVVNFTGKESRLGPNIATIEKSRFNRQALESRRPHFTNVLSDYKVVSGGTIGLQVEIRGAPTRVEWLREGCSVTEVYRNAKTFVEQGLYTLALSDVTEKESGMYTCRAWSSQCHVDMNAAITVVQPNELDGKPAIIVGRPEKDILISVGEDVNISFRVQGEPKPKVVFMKGIRDITTSQRACKMTSDDYVKFTLKRSVVSDAGTYCILARNAYGCDRAFVTVVVRQRASSDNLISDWTYPTDDSTLTTADRKYKSVPERIPGAPCVVEGGNNWISLGWPKTEPGLSAPVLAYKVESWLLGKEGGARWVELGITPLNSFDAFNLKQGEEYHFRVTPRNRYGWGESVQTSSPIGVGLAGDRPEFTESLPGQLKVLVGETANLSCSVKGTPAPEVVWMKNGHEIEDEDRRLSSSFNGFNCSLTIKDINIEDEARYSCEATNVHGRASTYARLAVVTDRSIWEADDKLKRERSADVEGDYPPQFTMRLRDRRVQATYPVRLTCQVIGSPDPRITWFKDGGEVKPDNRRCHFQDEHFHTLEIAPTTLEDGGVYEAMARNSSGAVSCRCNLVVDKGIRAYVAPEFCCGLEPLYRLTDGEELRISAVVEAYPSVGVTWYRDGVRLRPSRRAIMTLDRDGQIELALAAVTSRDAGVYSCTASNEVGRASTSGKVEVIGTNVTRTPPVFISPDEPYSKEPMFIRKPRSSEAREGDTVIIACEVVGDPKPDVYWLRDFLKPDYYRDSSHFKRMGDGPEYRFEIPHAKLDYTGAYSVVARNQHGEAKAVISLQILAKDLTSSDDSHNIRYGRVEVLPRFSKELTDLLSCDGDAVEFECRLTGHPEPHIRWFHYHELIRDSPDFETSFEDETARLKIKQVTAEDEGTYTCEAANNLGKVTSSACLVVYPPGEPNTLSQRLRRPPAFLSAASTPRSTPRSTPARSVSRTPGPEPRRLCSPARTQAPSFYTYPFNKVAEEGDSVSLQCAIKGNPAPWATWDKDGVIITPSSRITIKEKDDVLRVLEIDQVTIEDVGVYRITIENEFGRQEASARIEVITQKGKFYAGVRAVSPSPRKSLTYRGRRPSTPRQD